MAQPQAEDEPYAVEIAVNQAIAACDGDLRATIRAFIIANNLIEHELEHVIDFWCSSGFARGKLRIRDLRERRDLLVVSVPTHLRPKSPLGHSLEVHHRRHGL